MGGGKVDSFSLHFELVELFVYAFIEKDSGIHSFYFVELENIWRLDDSDFSFLIYDEIIEFPVSSNIYVDQCASDIVFSRKVDRKQISPIIGHFFSGSGLKIDNSGNDGGRVENDIFSDSCSVFCGGN